MLNVLLTVDTEVYPIAKDWKQDRLARDIKRDLYGQIDGHTVGLEYQLETFAKHELKANFMVESLLAAVPEVGPQLLHDIVRAIMGGHHDIQLHPHPEWLEHMPGQHVPFRSHLLRVYPLAEQEAIIRLAKDMLEAAGAPAPIAFRAGGFAANLTTLAALSRLGIRYDSSFNRCYRHDELQFPAPRYFGHVTEYDGVQEFPVSVFCDRPLHFRSAQICACSFAEMIHALHCAEAEGWDFFVIVSHSFEMLARRRHPTRPPVIRWDVVERFERLCEFLKANRDRFPTARFSDLDLSLSTPNGSSGKIKGKLLNTALRIFEQGASRLQTR